MVVAEIIHATLHRIGVTKRASIDGGKSFSGEVLEHDDGSWSGLVWVPGARVDLIWQAEAPPHADRPSLLRTLERVTAEYLGRDVRIDDTINASFCYTGATLHHNPHLEKDVWQ